jgi:hypothetical protein
LKKPCPSCNGPNPEWRTHCIYCGKPLVELPEPVVELPAMEPDATAEI